MTNLESWENLFKKHSLLPVEPQNKTQEQAPKIQTWVRVYPAKAPVKKGKRP
jgi:hypothetical protein